jgi:hypothetical protein
MLVTDFQLQLLYYDRSIHVISSQLDFIDDPKTLVWVVERLASLSMPDFGFEDLMSGKYTLPYDPHKELLASVDF